MSEAAEERVLAAEEWVSAAEEWVLALEVGSLLEVE